MRPATTAVRRIRRLRNLAVLGGAAFLTMAWPAPSNADTTLGGYSALAEAQAVRIQIYEPVIPLPSDPQIDGGIAFTKANTDTGPTSRGLASYLWPGDVVGDGFEQLTGKPGSKYPIQVNSRYPATNDSPATNAAQITDGNGMSTEANGTTTQGTVNGLGITGANPLGNPLSGICQMLGGKNCPTNSATSAVPVSVGPELAGLVTTTNVYSNSTVTLAAKSITATATTHVSSLKLLGGLVTLGGLDITSTTVSDGVKATTTGTSKIASLKIAGQAVELSDKGITLGGNSSKLPSVSLDMLKTIGIEVHYLQQQQSVTAATGSLAAQGLVISVDTKPLKQILHLDSITGPLQTLLEKIPNLGSQVGPLLSLGPKIVLQIGSVNTQATAAPQYVPPPITGSGGGSTAGSAGSSGGGLVTGGVPTGTLPSSGGAPTSNVPTGAPQTTTGTPTQQTAFKLPGLGSVPRALILGGLFLAGAIGLLFWLAGGWLLAGGASCSYGLETGVPDLRKG